MNISASFFCPHFHSYMLNPDNNELLINNKRIELWSSTVNGISAWNLNFNSNDANMYFNARANGFSLRRL